MRCRSVDVISADGHRAVAPGGKGVEAAPCQKRPLDTAYLGCQTIDATILFGHAGWDDPASDTPNFTSALKVAGSPPDGGSLTASARPVAASRSPDCRQPVKRWPRTACLSVFPWAPGRKPVQLRVRMQPRRCRPTRRRPKPVPAGRSNSTSDCDERSAAQSVLGRAKNVVR